MKNRFSLLMLAAASASASLFTTACDKHDPKVVWGEEAVKTEKQGEHFDKQKKPADQEKPDALPQSAESVMDAPKFFR